jgi:hypothetical protein
MDSVGRENVGEGATTGGGGGEVVLLACPPAATSPPSSSLPEDFGCNLPCFAYLPFFQISVDDNSMQRCTRALPYVQLPGLSDRPGLLSAFRVRPDGSSSSRDPRPLQSLKFLFTAL